MWRIMRLPAALIPIMCIASGYLPTAGLIELKEGGTIEVRPFVGGVIVGGDKSLQNSRATILKNGEPYIQYDLARIIDASKSEYIVPKNAHAYIGELYPLSPDERYMPVLCRKPGNGGGNGLFVILFDLLERRVFRQEITDDRSFISRYLTIKWQTNRQFTVHGTRMRHSAWLLHNIDDPTRNVAARYETSLVWDRMGVNYCTLYGKDVLYQQTSFAGEHEPTVSELFQLTADNSEAIKYNHYWIYPEFAQRIRKRHNWFPLDPLSRPETPIDSHGIRLRQVGADTRHVFSGLSFLADTPWVGCLEQVLPAGVFERVLETNVVLINGENVNTDPPLAEDVRIVKKRVAPLVPKNVSEYIDMAKYLSSRWNSKSKRLEIVRTTDGMKKESEMTYYELPITFEVDDAGETVPIAGECILHFKDNAYRPAGE